MKTIYLFFKKTCNLLLIGGSILLLHSCKKDEKQPTDPAQIFKPGSLSVQSGETSAKITWVKPLLSAGRAYQYKLDFSTDSLFSTTVFTTTLNTLEYVVTEANLKVRTNYYARIKALATDQQPESKSVTSSKFSLTGIQLFFPISNKDIKETGLTLKFKPTEGLSSIVLTPKTGAPVTVTLSAADALAGFKAVTGLSVETAYSAELFAGTSSRGYVTFTTLPLTVYTTILSAGADLAAAINSAANNAVIGLSPGTYNMPAIVTITNKTITLKSTSYEPGDTKVTLKGFALFGNGAGLKAAGIDFDGTSNTSTYFMDINNVTGNLAANFTTLTLDNCYIHGLGTSVLRGDRSTVNSYVFDNITVRNCKIYDITGSSAYYVFHLDKVIFNSINISESTFYKVGPALINFKTTTTPGIIPAININYCTFNNMGITGNLLMNAGANPVSFTMKNSIVANAPFTGTLTSLISATAATATINVSNCNTYNLLTALTGGTPLTFPSNTAGTNNLTLDPGWSAGTTVFTLPVGSVLRTAGTASTQLGDPQWIN